MDLCTSSSSSKALNFYSLTVYLNGYPYVLRDLAQPLQNIRAYLGIRANRLEQMEERLKNDIVKEAAKVGGLLLVHQELCKFCVGVCILR